MVIDTSALIAILFGEPEALLFSRAVADASRKLISAFNVLETGIVVEARKGESGASRKTRQGVRRVLQIRPI